MVKKNGLRSAAIMYSIYGTLAYSYAVKINYIPERYIAADLVSDNDFEMRERIAKDCIRAFEYCTGVGASRISSVTFPEYNVPLITMDNGTSFQLMTNVGPKKSWRASRSASYDRFFALLGCKDLSDAECKKDPLGVVAEQLRKMDSPQISHRIAGSLIPVSNFITLDVDQHERLISSTAYFYTKCGNVDKQVELPRQLLEIRRKSSTTLRCIYDKNWLFDFRLRRNAARDRLRLEWFLKDYPVGVFCQTTPFEMPVQIRISG